MSSKRSPISKYPNKIRVGITMGDPSGIGPAIIAKALPKLDKDAEFIVIGDKLVFDQATKRLAHNAQRTTHEFIDLNNVPHRNFQFGKVRAEYGRASIDYVDKALHLLRGGTIDCLVTAPISKEAVSKGGLKHFNGHTEYIANATNTKSYVMMLLNKNLRFSLVTRHIPLSAVPARITAAALSETISVTYNALCKLFSIKEPRMVVCGVNPHASDNGLIGKEENRIIKPALKRLSQSIRRLDSVLPADVAVSRAARGDYDCVIAMYHDQALIALKLSDPYSGVNLTLGLPFVRTSPLHGVAFDIADTPQKADPRSLIEAVKEAIACARNLKNI